MTKDKNRLLWAAAALLALPLLIRAYVGTRTSYAGDDFCWTMYLKEKGFFDLQWDIYDHAFGRWASTALLSVVPLGSGHWLLPGLSIVLLLGGVAWLCYELTHQAALSLLGAECLVIAMLAAAPGASLEPLYWQSGMLTYLPPFIVASVGAAAALRLGSAPIAFATAFLAAGFNEPFMTMEVVVLIAGVLAIRGQRRRLVAAALVGAMLSALIVVAAPGNVLRHELTDPRPIWEVGLLTLANTGLLVLRVAAPAGVLCFVIGLALARYVVDPLASISRWHVLGGAVVLALVGVAPSVYGVENLPDRTALVPAVALVIGAFALGLKEGQHLTLWPRATVAVVVIFVTFASWQAFSLAPRLEAYRDAWDTQEKTLLAASPGSAVVIDDVGSPFPAVWRIKDDPDWIINRCVASYFDVASVQTR